jgi:predicted kinase
MRRRSRRAPITTEQTGRIGQELPSNQPAPLVPFYPDEVPAAAKPAAPPPAQRPTQPTQSASPSRQPRSERSARPDGQGRDGQSRNEIQARTDGPNRSERRERPAPGDWPARQQWSEAAGTGRFELETQPETPSVPPPAPEAAVRSPQAPKGYVVLAIGLPGSGKTTWFRRRGVTPLSSDLLRNILFDDVEEQRYQGLVFSTLRSLLRARLIARMPWNYVDATNLSIHERRQWIKMAKSFGYEVQAVFFDVPLEVCLERNSKRDRSVSEEIMRKMGEKLKPPVFEEGFDKITVVRVKSAA